MSKETTNIKTIPALIKIIQQEISTGMEKSKAAVDSFKAITFWNIGKHIYSHIISKQDKPDYISGLFEQLSSALAIGARTLYWAVQFHELYPFFTESTTPLTWTHYKLLLRIHDPEQRENYTAVAINQELSTRDLEDLLRKEKLLITYNQKSSNLVINCNTPYIYKLKRLIAFSALRIDFGFNIYRVLPEPVDKSWQENTFIQVKYTNNRYSLAPVSDASDIHLYNYEAYVDEIVDGDTIWVTIDLGFGMSTCQKLRLHGVNTPDILSEAGKKAKRFIANRLKDCKAVLIKTYWRDKFNRYLADVFYKKDLTNVNQLVDEGTFLNQELLDAGLAVRY